MCKKDTIISVFIKSWYELKLICERQWASFSSIFLLRLQDLEQPHQSKGLFRLVISKKATWRSSCRSSLEVDNLPRQTLRPTSSIQSGSIKIEFNAFISSFFLAVIVGSSTFFHSFTVSFFEVLRYCSDSYYMRRVS
ncbi:hypothetical protein BY458DRAFT_492221 [Sporodiniella umbellata]|nr:hypothetical protein BY458DRAFT_492221 [Sporodiniella umbellata]